MNKIRLFMYLIAALTCIMLTGNYIFSRAETIQVAMNEGIDIREGLIYKIDTEQLFTGTVFDTVGEKIIEFDVIDGFKNGRFNLYSLQGKLIVEGHISNNKNDGEWNYFYPDGKLECKGRFAEDAIIDKWIWYYSDGTVKEEGYYINGEREGKWVTYDPNGNIKAQVTFKNDVVVNEIKSMSIKSI